MGFWEPIRYAHNGDVSIAYKTAGSGPVDMLFVPGFVGHLEIMHELPMAQRFWERIARFARVIVFDKRGMGLSDRSAGAYTLENIVDDALAVMDAAGAEKVVIFGVSEGGSAATMLAAAHPERVHSMIQYGTYARVSRAPDYQLGLEVDFLRSFWDRAAREWGSPAMLALWAPSLAGDPEAIEWWGRLLRSGTSPGGVGELRQMYEELDVRALLPTIRVPTLVIYRTADQMVRAEASKVVAAGIPDARAIELPGADHVPFAGDQEALLGPIEEFVTGRAPEVVTDRLLATVLFTDIVGSTERAATLGDSRWRDLLDRHARLVEREVDRHRGRLVKSTGDGVLATFDGPARAVRSALGIREAARELDLELRAGLHTGECELMGGDVAGMAVHLASRVESSARPGEVLTSGTVKDLVVGSGLQFEDRGVHELKGVPGRWPLFAVAGDSG